MATLQTNFNVAPYYDDFDPNKQYYRILFRPATAVQARELTQLQSILQNQISVFGSSIYQDGTIISGCGFTQYPNIPQVKFKDSNTTTLDFGVLTLNHSDLANANMLVSNTTGVRAVVFRAFNGAESAVNAGLADTNRAYIQYLTTGNNAGVQVSTFNTTSEQIDVYSPAQDYMGPLVAANKLGSIYTLSSNATVNALGVGYGIHLAQGQIYQKGFFLKTNPDNFIIREHVSNAVGIKVGFSTQEYIVQPSADPSLYDNSIGSVNYSAPGAHRLQLVPTAVYYDSSNTLVSVPTGFLPVLDFSGGPGTPVTSNPDPQLAAIGDIMAKRTFEESGDYVVTPFQIDVTSHESNNQLFYYGLTPGIAYVDGYRVELLSTKKVAVPRAITTDWQGNQKVTANFGNYIRLRNVAGTFDIGNLQEITFYSANQNILSLNNTMNNPLGNPVGKANIRAINYSTISSTQNYKGFPTGEMLAYIFNVRMNQGSSFAANAKSIFATGSTGGNFGAVWGDLVPNAITGQSEILEPTNGLLIYNTGLTGVKSLTSNTGVNVTNYIYRVTQTTAMTRSGGGAAANFTAPYDTYNYGLGALSVSNETAVNLMFAQDTESNPVLTPSSSPTINTHCVGSQGISSTTSNINFLDTSFNYSSLSSNAYMRAGAGVKLYYNNGSGVTNSIHTIVSINSANSMTVYPALTGIPVANTITISKWFKKGTYVDFSGSGNSIIMTSSTTCTANVSFDPLTGQSYSFNLQMPLSKASALPIQKVPNKGIYVAINCASHWAGSAGPWNLGLPDVYSISNIYVGSTFDIANPDKTGWFQLNPNQSDTAYNLSQLNLLPQYKGYINSSSRILVKLNSFTANVSTTKAGFFSIDSYPIDDANTANTQAIQTAQIPVYNSVSGLIYDLRNWIDFRPVFANTAVVTNVFSSATINPANNNSVFVTGGNPIAIEPNANFVYNVLYYLPRIDNLVINKDGTLDTKFGTPSLNPVPQSINTSGLKVATISVPPYPSLTFTEAQ